MLSLACYLCNHLPLLKRGASPEAHFLSSLGVYLFVVQAAVIVFGNETRMLRSELGQTVQIGSTNFPTSQLVGAAVSVLLIISVLLGLRCTHFGLLLRATADNPAQSSLLGVPVRYLEAFAFGLSGGLCGIAGYLHAYECGIDPNGGFALGLPAIAAVIIGGRNSWLGPTVGGLLVGFLRTGATWFLRASWQDGVTFVLLVAVLALRPKGLLGTEVRTE